MPVDAAPDSVNSAAVAVGVDPGARNVIGENTSPAGDPPSVDVSAATESMVIARLAGENSPPAEWRREALARHREGRVEECGRILEAAENHVGSAVGSSIDPERVSLMQHLALYYLDQVLVWPRGTPEEITRLVEKARDVLDRSDSLELAIGKGANLDGFVAKGFLALIRHVFRCSCKGDELKRSELLFDSALRLDSNCPRALAGKAIVLTCHKEWNKALSHFRQVLKRAAPKAPKGGQRLQSLKHIRFAIAACFSELGRFEQMRNALGSVVAADPYDVESLCALVHLEAKVSKDGVGKSLEYLDGAVKANQYHPVVLCQLANHAFYCGLEQGPENNNNGEQSPWDTAQSLLKKAVALTKAPKVKAEIHFQMGRLEHARNDAANAYTQYKLCANVMPEHFACLYGLAQVCVQTQKFTEAINALEAIKKKKHDLPEVFKLLTFAYLQTGVNAADAVKAADTLVTIDKENMEAWALRAEAHDQLCAQQNVAPKVGTEVYEHMAKLLDTGDGERRAAATPQMWNNLGTLRGLQGDPAGAKEAYAKGLEVAERTISDKDSGPTTAEEAKDLHVARLTMRFNRAWLAENEGDAPHYMQATQDYMAISEEHNWYADSLLQLGAQWQRMGEVEIAVQRYQEAFKQSPVNATLMQAELHRHKGEYSDALQCADTAVQSAGEKQFHYAHVYLGNLYYEVACAPSTKTKDREGCLHKALRHFTLALGKQKDSHYAANGIGMVFALRGKYDFARRTFQSVMQHHAMAGDPSVFVNLGHCYLQSGGENTRKAIALYERAKKIKPNDLNIRLYLAKAQFRLQAYDLCIGVLGDAMHVWPDDLMLRYNLAMALESYGVYLVSEEKKTNRVVGVDNGMLQMNHAVQLLGSAVRLFDFVYQQWLGKTDEERKHLIEASGGILDNTTDVSDGIFSASAHRLYCQDIQAKARDELVNLQEKRVAIDKRMRENDEYESQVQESLNKEQQQQVRTNQEHLEEDEDRALDLEEKARAIDLGKNLEYAKINFPDSKKKPAPAKAPPGKKPGDLPAHMQPAAPLPAGDEDDRFGEKRPLKDKKDKKDKKNKDGKKDKKDKKDKDKKNKKQKTDDAPHDDDPFLGGVSSGAPAADVDSGDEQPDDDDEDIFGDAPDAVDAGDQEDKKKKKDKEKKKEKKKDKKKDKKDKKEKNKDSDDEVAAPAGGEDMIGGGDDDEDLEKELFGEDTSLFG